MAFRLPTENELALRLFEEDWFGQQREQAQAQAQAQKQSADARIAELRVFEEMVSRIDVPGRTLVRLYWELENLRGTAVSPDPEVRARTDQTIDRLARALGMLLKVNIGRV